MKLRAFAAVVVTATVGLFSAASAHAALGDVPTPAVSGPVPITNTSYPFLSTDIDLAQYGYVEEEFFIEGDGYRYDTFTSTTFDETAPRIETGGPTLDGLYPFKTRIVVRRPANPADANGTAIVEWNNVTATQDIEWNWFSDPEYLLKNGYTWVGVTAQNTGVNSLLAFDPVRYAGLTVNGGGTVPTGQIDPGCVSAPGLPCATYDNDSLSYDVFGSAVKAVLGGGTGVNPLGGITPDTIIASGESQSCSRLSTHYNRISENHEIIDAYLLTVCTSRLRTDRPEKAVRLITESENRTQRPETTHPDTSSIRHWEVAGASHLPRMAFDNINNVLTRDFAELTVTCQKFPLSLVQWPFTQNRATDALVDWVESGTVPPIAPRGVYTDPTTIERDQYGIARGGIRYPAVTVPTAVNDGLNASVPGGPIFSAFCGLLGSSTPFSQEQLAPLYTDFADYLEKHDAAANAMLPGGFILAEDIERLKASARQFAEIRPTAPLLIGENVNRGAFGLTWVGTEAPDTTFQVQRSEGDGWVDVNATIDGATATVSGEPQGSRSYRVRSSTVLPGTNISEARTVTPPYSEALAGIKVDSSGPKAPRIIVKGKKYRKAGKNGRKGKVVKNTYTGKVRVRFVGRPDQVLPDGTAGVGLNRKSVPKTRVIKKKGRTVIKVSTKDNLGNRSKTVRKVIKIKKVKKSGKR